MEILTAVDALYAWETCGSGCHVTDDVCPQSGQAGTAAPGIQGD